MLGEMRQHQVRRVDVVAGPIEIDNHFVVGKSQMLVDRQEFHLLPVSFQEVGKIRGPAFRPLPQDAFVGAPGDDREPGGDRGPESARMIRMVVRDDRLGDRLARDQAIRKFDGCIRLQLVSVNLVQGQVVAELEHRRAGGKPPDTLRNGRGFDNGRFHHRLRRRRDFGRSGEILNVAVDFIGVHVDFHEVDIAPVENRVVTERQQQPVHGNVAREMDRIRQLPHVVLGIDPAHEPRQVVGGIDADRQLVTFRRDDRNQGRTVFHANFTETGFR